MRVIWSPFLLKGSYNYNNVDNLSFEVVHNLRMKHSNKTYFVANYYISFIFLLINLNISNKRK